MHSKTLSLLFILSTVIGPEAEFECPDSHRRPRPTAPVVPVGPGGGGGNEALQGKYIHIGYYIAFHSRKYDCMWEQ